MGHIATRVTALTLKKNNRSFAKSNALHTFKDLSSDFNWQFSCFFWNDKH